MASSYNTWLSTVKNTLAYNGYVVNKAAFFNYIFDYTDLFELKFADIKTGHYSIDKAIFTRFTWKELYKRIA